MTYATTPAPALVDDLAALLSGINEMMRRHPALDGLRLVYVPDELAVGEDEVLIQRVDPDSRVITLHPCKTSGITPQDVPHATQAWDPSDEVILAYAGNQRSASCEATVKDGRLSHLYRL